MHIPDGFLSPETYLPAYGVAAVTWAYSLEKAKKKLNERLIAHLGMMSVFVLFASLLQLPVPGGSSVHITAFPLMTMLFGLPIAHLAYTVVLVIQALFFGSGGITSLGANSLIMGFFSGVVVIAMRRLTRRLPERWSVFLSTAVPILLSAFLFAMLLGIQPVIAVSDSGSPLFFPFGLDVTVPAVMFAHIWLAATEGAITAYVFPVLRRILNKDK